MRILAQIDPEQAGSLLDRIPHTPGGWVGWLVFCLVAAVLITLWRILPTKPQLETPMPPPSGFSDAPSCRIDHSAISTRLQFLERDVAEIRAMHKESIDVAREAAEAGREAARAIREAVRLLESLSSATSQSAQVLHQAVTAQNTTMPLWAQQVVNELRGKAGGH